MVHIMLCGFHLTYIKGAPLTPPRQGCLTADQRARRTGNRVVRPRGVPQRPSQSPSPCLLPSRLAHRGSSALLRGQGDFPGPHLQDRAWLQGHAPQLRTAACCHQLPASERMLTTRFPSLKGLVRTRAGLGSPHCSGEASRPGGRSGSGSVVFPGHCPQGSLP